VQLYGLGVVRIQALKNIGNHIMQSHLAFIVAIKEANLITEHICTDLENIFKMQLFLLVSGALFAVSYGEINQSKIQ